MISGPELGRREPVRSPAVTTRRDAENYLACSPAAQRLLGEVARAERSHRPVPLLIGGETGTGKTLLARTIHRHAARSAHQQSGKRATLHVVNCAALRDALLEEALAPLSDRSSEPDGCETVLLDEVGELSPRGQEVLAERIEARRRLTPRAHFIAASQRDLDALTSGGKFHAGLFEMLSGSRVFLAPLRKRRDEILPLATHFLRRALAASGRASIVLSPQLLDCIERHAWPGNARELQNALLGALAMNDDGHLAYEDLPESVRRADARSGPHPLPRPQRASRVVHAYAAGDEA